MISIARMAVIGAAAMLAFAAIGTIASIGGITTTAAYAQALGNGGHGTPRTDSPTGTGQPTDPNCFGEINSGLAQSSGGVGEHASDPVPGDDDNETPRLGVGNQAEGTPGEHGLTVGPGFGQQCEEGPSSQN
ncbi:MAG: hypothetical protein ACJ70Z_07960 [Nitrososphaera sp.]